MCYTCAYYTYSTLSASSSSYFTHLNEISRRLRQIHPHCSCWLSRWMRSTIGCGQCFGKNKNNSECEQIKKIFVFVRGFSHKHSASEKKQNPFFYETMPFNHFRRITSCIPVPSRDIASPLNRSMRLFCDEWLDKMRWKEYKSQVRGRTHCGSLNPFCDVNKIWKFACPILFSTGL